MPSKKTPLAPKAKLPFDPKGTPFIVKDQLLVVEWRRKPTTKNAIRSASELELMYYIAQHEDTLFNDEEKALFYKVTSRGSGHGEFSIRAKKGAAPKLAGAASLDIDEVIDGIKVQMEIKEYPKVRPGFAAIEWWGEFTWKFGLYERHSQTWEKEIIFNGKQTTFAALFRGSTTLTLDVLEAMPAELSDEIRDRLKPSNTMRSYPAIAMTWPEGYIVVKHENFDEAFMSTGVSLRIPTYKLNRVWLEKQVSDILAKQQIPNGVPIDAIGNVVKESPTVTSAEELPHLSPANVNAFATGDGLKPDLTPNVEVPHVLLQVASREVSVEVVGV